MDPNFEQAQDDLRKEEKKLGVSIRTLFANFLDADSMFSIGHHQEARESPVRSLPLTFEFGGEPADREENEE